MLALVGRDAAAWAAKSGVTPPPSMVNFVGSVNPTVRVGGTITDGEPVVLFEFTIENDSGSNAAANTYARPIYLEFQEGDIPSGQCPVFRVESDGDTIPYSYHFKQTWADGSWAGATFLLLPPDAINDGASLTCECLNGGSEPTASSRARTDANAGSDIKTEVTFAHGGTGVWTSSCEDGSPDFQDEAPGSGGINRYFKDRCWYRDGSSNAHEHLLADHYRIMLQDHNGAFYGLLHLARTMQPYVDNLTNRGARAFTQLRLLDGASEIRAQVPSTTGGVCTADASTDRLTFSGPTGFDRYSKFVLTSDGTPPAPLVNGELYSANSGLGTGVTNVQVSQMGSVLDITDAGSGEHTATPVFSIAHANSFFSCGDAGELDFFQAGGSGSAPLCTVKKDKTYARGARIGPPVKSGLSWDTPTTYSYLPNIRGPLTNREGDAGDGNGRGLTPMHLGFQAHFDRCNAADRRYARLLGLFGGHRDNAMYESATHRVPVVNNTSYTGLGTAHPTWRFLPYEFLTNMPNSADATSGGQKKGSTWVNDYAHAPGIYGPPFLAFGEWQYWDLCLEAAVAAMAAYSRGTVNGVTYYSVAADQSQARLNAWMRKMVFWAGALRPDDCVERQYVDDACEQHWEYMLARITHDTRFNDYLRSIGYYSEVTSSGNGGGFMHTFFLSTIGAFSGAIRATATAAQIRDYVAKFAVYRNAFNASAFNNWWRKGGDSSAICDEDTPVLFQATRGALVYSADDDTFTLQTSGVYTPTNGDRIMEVDSVPGGMTQYQHYYVVEASGSTFKISDTPGGSPVNITTSGTQAFYVYPSNPGTNQYHGIFEYHLNAVGASNLLLAAGSEVEGLAQLCTDLEAIATANGMPAADTSFAFASSY